MGSGTKSYVHRLRHTDPQTGEQKEVVLTLLRERLTVQGQNTLEVVLPALDAVRSRGFAVGASELERKAAVVARLSEHLVRRAHRRIAVEGEGELNLQDTRNRSGIFSEIYDQRVRSSGGEELQVETVKVDATLQATVTPEYQVRASVYDLADVRDWSGLSESESEKISWAVRVAENRAIASGHGDGDPNPGNWLPGQEENVVYRLDLSQEYELNLSERRAMRVLLSTISKRNLRARDIRALQTHLPALFSFGEGIEASHVAALIPEAVERINSLDPLRDGEAPIERIFLLQDSLTTGLMESHPKGFVDWADAPGDAISAIAMMGEYDENLSRPENGNDHLKRQMSIQAVKDWWTSIRNMAGSAASYCGLARSAAAQ